MDCSEDRAIAEDLDKGFKLKTKKSMDLFTDQYKKTMTTQECQSGHQDPAAAEHEERLLQGKTRQQYHDDNLKAVRVALWAEGQKNKPY